MEICEKMHSDTNFVFPALQTSVEWTLSIELLLRFASEARFSAFHALSRAA